MPVRIDEYDSVCVVSLTGDFAGEDVATARKMSEAAIVERQLKGFVVDVEKMPFVDSEGLEALLWLKRRCEDLYGQFKLAGADENVKRVFEVTRLSRQFDHAKDVQSALKAMRS